MARQELIDKALDRIKHDVEVGDMTAIEELLTGVSSSDVEAYLPEVGYCRLCGRQHDKEQPCPVRIANALMMRPQGLANCTGADRDWIAQHPFSMVDLVEGQVASML